MFVLYLDRQNFDIGGITMLAIVLFVIGYLVIVAIISFAAANRDEEKKNIFKKIRGRKRTIRTKLLRGGK